MVNVKAIVIGIMDRLSEYASQETEPEQSEVRLQKEQEAARKFTEIVMKETQPIEVIAAPEPAPETPGSNAVAKKNITRSAQDQQANQNAELVLSGGITEDIKLYEIFYEQVLNLVNVRTHTRQLGRSISQDQSADFSVSSKAQNLPIQDIIALLVSLANLALKIYPNRLRKLNFHKISLYHLTIELEYVDQVLE